MLGHNDIQYHNKNLNTQHYVKNGKRKWFKGGKLVLGKECLIVANIQIWSKLLWDTRNTIEFHKLDNYVGK
jgi:hypothetical protein